MIRRIKLIRNIGRFNDVKALDFKRLVLIYGENGTGKTTLAAILRSLATDDPAPINERRRFGSEHTPHVVLECGDGAPSVVFQNGTWSGTAPVEIFDDAFIDANVCSGLEVDPQHRQNLAELVLGEQGVKLTRELGAIIAKDEENGKSRTAKERAIPSEKLRGLKVREFCDLPELPDIDASITNVERNLEAVREQDAVQTTGAFEGIVLPAIDIDAIKQVLSRDLAGLDSEAESRVRDHIASLTSVDEQWIAAGMDDNLQKGGNKCPFCGQDTTGVALVAHYRAYFSEGYAELKRGISRAIDNLRNAHAQGAQVKFIENVRDAERKSGFWARFCDVPTVNVDTEAISRAWDAAFQAMLSILESKQAAPLEKFGISDYDAVAVEQYNSHRQQITALNQGLEAANTAILGIKENSALANSGDLDKELSRLLATKDRYSDHIAPLCDDYIAADDAKKRSANERDKVRTALDEHRKEAFPAMRKSVNKYIDRFNTGFCIGSLTPFNTSRGPSCTYNVLINNTEVAVRGGNVPDGTPAFRNTLSAGDRSTLALALFFASLEQNPDLANTVVVMDDPMSSLDDHRSHSTVNEIRHLLHEAGQVIILSHSKRFLCDVWDAIPQQDCLALEVVNAGSESKLQHWDAHRDSITEHDRRYALLQDYIDSGSGDREEIARAIRRHLESYLRVACPDSFKPGTMIGPFLNHCRNAGPGKQILTKAAIEELEQIVNYANRFHHVPTPPLNDAELRGFVRRTLVFTGPTKL